MALSLGILFGLLAMVAWGLSKVLVKGAVDRLGNTSALFFNYVFMILVIGAVVPATTPLKALSPGSWKIFAIAIPIGVLGIYSLFRALGTGKNSLLLPIAHSSVIITTLLSIIFFQETLSAQQVLGLVLIIAGIILVSFKLSEVKRFDFSKPIPGGKLALVTMVCWGLWFFLIKFIIDDVGPLVATLYLEGANTVLVLGLTLLGMKKFGKLRVNSSGLLWIAGAGGLAGIGSLLYNFAVFNGTNAIVNTLGQASLLIAVLGSFVILQEKIEKNQKLAIGIIVLGILLVSV